MALLTRDQAARLLGVSRATVQRLIARGELDSIKVGHLRRIPDFSVISYIARRLDVERHGGGCTTGSELAAWVAESRRAQGLPETIKDPEALAKVAALVVDALAAEQERGGDARPA